MPALRGRTVPDHVHPGAGSLPAMRQQSARRLPCSGNCDGGRNLRRCRGHATETAVAGAAFRGAVSMRRKLRLPTQPSGVPWTCDENCSGGRRMRSPCVQSQYALHFRCAPTLRPPPGSSTLGSGARPPLWPGRGAAGPRNLGSGVGPPLWPGRGAAAARNLGPGAHPRLSPDDGTRGPRGLGPGCVRTCRPTVELPARCARPGPRPRAPRPGLANPPATRAARGPHPASGMLTRRSPQPAGVRVPPAARLAAASLLPRLTVCPAALDLGRVRYGPRRFLALELTECQARI